MLTAVKRKKHKVLTLMDNSGTLNFKLCYCMHYLPTYNSMKVPSGVFCDPFTIPASTVLYKMSGVQKVRTAESNPMKSPNT